MNKIVIIWSGDEELLSKTIEQIIVDSQCFLFTVICGGTDESKLKSSSGYRWAIRNGAPVEFMIEADVEKLLNKIAQTADYIVCYNNGNQLVKRLIMKFKSQGKHGTVIVGE